MIYFVKCFTEIYTAQVDCVTTFNKAVNYLTDSKNGMIAAHPLFETKLFIVSERNSPNFSIKQYSNNFDIIGLMAIPRKSSHVMAISSPDEFLFPWQKCKTEVIDHCSEDMLDD